MSTIYSATKGITFIAFLDIGEDVSVEDIKTLLGSTEEKPVTLTPIKILSVSKGLIDFAKNLREQKAALETQIASIDKAMQYQLQTIFEPDVTDTVDTSTNIIEMTPN